jgi:hypothetical protein
MIVYFNQIAHNEQRISRRSSEARAKLWWEFGTDELPESPRYRPERDGFIEPSRAMG